MHAAADNQSGNFSGVWQMFLYNRHFYAAALVLDLIAAVFLVRFSSPAAVRFVVVLGAAISTFWALSSLLVSYYVYDRSRLYQWNWLGEVLKRNPASWVDTSRRPRSEQRSADSTVPAAKRRILDVYVSSEMSEPSIARRVATLKQPPHPKRNASFALKKRRVQHIFLFLFVAHELRRQKAKLRFPRGGSRPEDPAAVSSCRTPARLEKLYGPGSALHFFSRREWLFVGNRARFS